MPKPESELWYYGLTAPRENPTCSYGWHVRTFDGSEVTGSGIVERQRYNQTEYVANYYALGFGLKYLYDREPLLRESRLVIRSSHQFSIHQLTGKYRCNSDLLQPLLGRCRMYLERVYAPGDWQAETITVRQNQRCVMLAISAWEAKEERPLPKQYKESRVFSE